MLLSAATPIPIAHLHTSHFHPASLPSLPTSPFGGHTQLFSGPGSKQHPLSLGRNLPWRFQFVWTPHSLSFLCLQKTTSVFFSSHTMQKDQETPNNNFLANSILSLETNNRYLQELQNYKKLKDRQEGKETFRWDIQKPYSHVFTQTSTDMKERCHCQQF